MTRTLEIQSNTKPPILRIGGRAAAGALDLPVSFDETILDLALTFGVTFHF